MKSLRSEARDRLAERDRKEGDDPPPAPPPPNIGLYHEESYVVRTVAMLRLSNFQCWPESGGWADQDDLLVRDVQMYLALEARMAWEAQYGNEEDSEHLIPIAPSNAKPLRMNQLGM